MFRSCISFRSRHRKESFLAPGFRILHNESGQLVLTDPIFDEPANDMAPIGPILALQASNNSCKLMYRKSDIDRSSTPEICLERIDVATQQAEQSIEECAESALLCQI